MRDPQKGADLLAMKNINVFPLDVLDMASIEAAIKAMLDQFGAIDVLFNNAGYAIAGAFEAISPERIEKQFATNVFGAINTTRTILPYFREKRRRLIINTTSIGGRITFPLYSIYNSTKWAVEGFKEALQSFIFVSRTLSRARSKVILRTLLSTYPPQLMIPMPRAIGYNYRLGRDPEQDHRQSLTG